MLATKVFSTVGDGPNDRDASRYHIIKACEDSLRRLQTDHIDLYQLHRPSAIIPQDETLRAFDDLIRVGQGALYRRFDAPGLEGDGSAGISEREHLARYISEQPPYNLLDRRIENELVPLCQQYGLAMLPWSPLAGGILAGRYDTNGTAFPKARGRRAAAQMFRDRITAARRWKWRSRSARWRRSAA